MNFRWIDLFLQLWKLLGKRSDSLWPFWYVILEFCIQLLLNIFSLFELNLVSFLHQDSINGFFLELDLSGIIPCLLILTRLDKCHCICIFLLHFFNRKRARSFQHLVVSWQLLLINSAFRFEYSSLRLGHLFSNDYLAQRACCIFASNNVI